MKKFLSIAVLSLLVFGCTKESVKTEITLPEEAPAFVKYTFTTDNPETKSTLTDGGVFAWTAGTVETGDNIAVWNANANAFRKFYVSSVENNKATITGEAEPGANFTVAIYPYAAAVNESSVTYNSGVSGPILVAQVPASGTDLAFKYLGSVINLTINGDVPAAVTRIGLKANANVFGEYSFSFNAQSGAVELGSLNGTGNNNISAPFSGAGQVQSLAIPRATYAGLAITLKDDAGFNYYKKETTNTFDLSGKILLPMPALTYSPAKLFYAHVINSNNSWFDDEYILLQSDRDKYEVDITSDGGLTAYIYDEYNIGNDVTGVGMLAQAGPANDANKYCISYVPSTKSASVDYVCPKKDNPFNWGTDIYTRLYLRGQFEGTNENDWKNSEKFAAFNTKPNHLVKTTLTIGEYHGNMGIQAEDGDWWAANSGDGNYKTITAGAEGVYYACFVAKSNKNETITLPAGTYTVYANFLNDTYEDKPIRLMFVKNN